jgi:flagellar basal-body rod protein FlgF
LVRGLYTAGWGMMARSKEVDVISNNLANINTNGFKKDGMVYASFEEAMVKRTHDASVGTNPARQKVGPISLGTDVGELYTEYSQGAPIKTDLATDMAITGAQTAFFAVDIGDSKDRALQPGIESTNDTIRYTRDGAFSLNSEGVLVSKDGYPVQTEQGPITLPSDNFRITERGDIIANEELVGRLKIVQVQQQNSPESIRKLGNNLVSLSEDALVEPFSGSVRQGMLEASNVNSVHEMVSMIQMMRSYESNQKVITTYDSLLERAISEVGAVK